MLLTTCVTTTDIVQQYFKTKEWFILNGNHPIYTSLSQLKMSSYDFLYPERNQDKNSPACAEIENYFNRNALRQVKL